MLPNDSITYYVPPADSRHLFSLENLQEMEKLGVDRPRITAHKVNPSPLVSSIISTEIAKKSHQLCFRVAGNQ